MSSATRQVVCLQDFALSKRLEHAELRGCYRVRPDLPTNCGSPDRRRNKSDDELADEDDLASDDLLVVDWKRLAPARVPDSKRCTAFASCTGLSAAKA